MITSTPANRSGARLVLLVAQERVETNVLYQMRPIRDPADNRLFLAGSEWWTWCNTFVAAVCARMGCPLPPGLRANGQYAYLSRQADGWEQVDANTARARADHGQLVVPAWPNPEKHPDGTERSGHVAVLMPSLGDEFGLWTAQAGKVNFTYDRMERGFGASKKPDFFSHR